MSTPGPEAAETPAASPWVSPPAAVDEVTRLLEAAAYFPIFNVHNSAIPNDTVPLLPIATQTLGQALFTAVNVNEVLHRFEVETWMGPQGPTAANWISSRDVANVTIRFTPIPDDYSPSPGVSPRPTLLNPFKSQRVTMLNGQLSFQDRKVSGVQAFGSGRTFPVAGGSGSLNLGAVIDVLEGFGALYGLSDETLPGATMVINGFITPPNDLALSLILRVMDPDGQLAASVPVPPLVKAAPTPQGSGVFMFFLGEADPRRPTRILYGPGGTPSGAQTFENLRSIRIGFNEESLHSSTRKGPIAGTASAMLSCNLANQSTVTQAQTTASVFRFHDSQGRSLGSLAANMVEGRAFRTYLPGASSYPVFRLGGFGPFSQGSGVFAGAQGMMSMNGVISVYPPTLSNLYVLRFEDPEGRFQDRLQGAGLTGFG
jgi:hypothetical protein